MNLKKIIFDSAFILIASIILIFVVEHEPKAVSLGFALIPILIAYFLGQYVEQKTCSKSDENCK